MLNMILTKEEYISYFCDTDAYIKREYYERYITRRLAEEFDMKYIEKRKRWCTEWKNNRRFVVELEGCGTAFHSFLRWGFNYDFIPDINNAKKLVWHRTDNSVKIQVDDSWHRHVEHTKDKEWGFTEEELHNPEKCMFFRFEIPNYTSDIEFALKYIYGVVEQNILFMKSWLDGQKTIDDAIQLLIKRIGEDPVWVVRYEQHVLAFLYAKNQNLETAMSTMMKRYDGNEIPRVIVKNLTQLASVSSSFGGDEKA